jgi:hypothetical protein
MDVLRQLVAVFRDLHTVHKSATNSIAVYKSDD